MRRAWAFRVVVAVSVLCAAAPAVAHSPQPACQQLRDAKGDVQPAAGIDAVPVQDARDAELDIVSADIAADSKNVTTVIRLSSLTPPDPNDPNGLMYYFYFTAQEQTFWLSASILIGGTNYEAWAEDRRADAGDSSAQSGSALGTATGSLDLRRHEVRITAPLSLFEPKAHLTTGTSFYKLQAWSWRSNGISSNDSFAGTGESADVAHDDKVSYRVGQPSCIL